MPINQTPAENVKVGDVVQVEDWPKPAMVKSVHFVFHMDNNMDLVVSPSDKLWVVQQ